MICPACGSEFPDEMPVCPYCQTHVPEHTPDVHAYDAYYCADTVSLRKNHWIDFFIGLLFVIALTVLAIFFQLQKPSLSTQIRRADAAELAEICTEYPAETADDTYTQTLLNAINIQVTQQLSSKDASSEAVSAENDNTESQNRDNAQQEEIGSAAFIIEIIRKQGDKQYLFPPMIYN